MELKHLLSITTAALTALGAMLYAMGPQQPWLALALWMAAILSLVVNDFLGVLRLPRNVGSLAMWCILIVFLPQFLLHSSWEGRLQTVASILLCLQCTLLFQDKDARVYGWLAVMSLLQVVVAARYSRGVAFGSLLIVYTIVGMLALSLLALYSREQGAGSKEQGAKSRERGAGKGRELRVESPAARRLSTLNSQPSTLNSQPSTPLPAPLRWSLAGVEPGFTSTLSATPTQGTGYPARCPARSGIVAEFFGRLTLTIAGALILATVIFYSVPRPKIPSWPGDSKRTLSVVGYEGKITLGRLGTTIESREEVMRVRLLDDKTREPFPMRSPEIYLRGSVVTWYSQNQWRHEVPVGYREQQRRLPDSDDGSDADAPNEDDPVFRIGPPVIQRTTLEPYLDRFDLVYLWPLIEPVDEQHQPILYEPGSEHLFRPFRMSGEPYTTPFTFEVRTSALVDGQQAPLVPAQRAVRVPPLLQMPDTPAPLSGLIALADDWRRESGLSDDEHCKIAQYFRQQLSSSGRFHYSLQGVDRDTSIDAIEDFVIRHPSGHCEYFATALALMLRSQGIPSRVVLGYRCDEWDRQGQYFQVRQLHAHAWVEAFLAPDQIPESLRREAPRRWIHGGWLRLDGTPGEDVGTSAADRTAWGKWQARWHGLQHYWESYIADMDQAKQRESVYEPIRRGLRDFLSRLFSPSAWRGLFVGLWAALAATLRNGIIGKLIVAVLVIAVAGMLSLAVRWLARLVARLWRRLAGHRGLQFAGAHSSVEFYHRFEQLAARCGLRRNAGQTPREFACAAGARLAKASGRPELFDRAVQVAEAFYRVRFGRQAMDAVAAQAVQMALDELKQCSALKTEH